MWCGSGANKPTQFRLGRTRWTHWCKRDGERRHQYVRAQLRPTHTHTYTQTRRAAAETINEHETAAAALKPCSRARVKQALGFEPAPPSWPVCFHLRCWLRQHAADAVRSCGLLFHPQALLMGRSWRTLTSARPDDAFMVLLTQVADVVTQFTSCCSR